MLLYYCHSCEVSSVYRFQVVKINWPEPRLVEEIPMANKGGDLCGLCDSTSEHSHPRLKCTVCGAVGLAENMPTHACKPYG